MTNPKIYVDTVGAEVSILSHADLVTDVASVVISVEKPSGAIDTWTPTSIDPASVSNCIINYTTQAGDLDEAGTYRVQPVVTMIDDDVWPIGVALWTIYARYEGL